MNKYLLNKLKAGDRILIHACMSSSCDTNYKCEGKIFTITSISKIKNVECYSFNVKEIDCYFSTRDVFELVK